MEKYSNSHMRTAQWWKIYEEERKIWVDYFCGGDSSKLTSFCYRMLERLTNQRYLKEFKQI